MAKATDDLYAELRKVTKVANQRMVRLEKKGIESFAYKIAVNDITNILGKESGLPRFSVRKSMSFNEIESQLKYANKFINSTSSTVSGMKKTVKKRNATLYKKYGATQYEPLYRILSSESYKKLVDLLPSTMVTQSINDALNSGMSEESISNKLDSLIRQENDDYLIDTMQQMLGEI